MFIDWIKCYQTFDFDIPEYDGGYFVKGSEKDSDGQREVEQATQCYKPTEGSFSSNINIRSDGRTLYFDGNAGKFHRQDNVFNLNLEETMLKVNEILAGLGFPPFTSGHRIYKEYRSKSGEIKESIDYTGAVFTRLDLTDNFTLGCEQDLKDYRYFLATQKPTRQQVSVYGDCGTIYFGGKGSRNLSAKFYDKTLDLLDNSDQNNEYISELTEYCKINGIGRFEMTCKSTYLHNNFLRFWGEVTHEKLTEIYRDYSQQVIKETEIMDIDNLTKTHKATYYDYINGVNVKARMSNGAFYRHRNELLSMGIDIAMPLNVKQLKRPVKVLTIKKLEMPDWYQLRQAS